MVSFDWAMKRLLRNKANFGILEGFLSELLSRKIMIKSISESEGNKSDKKNKSNRVDIFVEADDRELVIIELHYLKNNQIRDNFTAKGIDKARKILAYERLTEEEKREHDRLVEENRNRESEILTAYTDGEFKGREEGREEGEAINQKKVIANGKKAGYSVEIMATMTGLTHEEVRKIIEEFEV